MGAVQRYAPPARWLSCGDAVSKPPKLPRWAAASDFAPGFLKGVATLESAARVRRRQYGTFTGFVELAVRHAAERQHAAPDSNTTDEKKSP